MMNENKRPTFLGRERPAVVCMIASETIGGAMEQFLGGESDGCDAFGLQYERLARDCRTDENLKKLFAAAGERPVYVTNYRSAANAGVPDEELAEELLRLCGLGATLLDVPGDLFCPDPTQLTRDPDAVRRQTELAARIHAAGGEVLFSSHTLRFQPADEILGIALAQRERGADIAKIVARADTEEEELENLRTVTVLREKLGIPFLFLSAGTHCKLLRQAGPFLGCSMWLTVHEQNEFTTRSQPLCADIRAIADHFSV